MPAMSVLAAVLSFAAAFGVLRLLLSQFARVGLDEPNARSLHERPVPRTGGLAIFAGTAVSFAFGASDLWAPLVAAAALAGLSFLDDLFGLPTAARLCAHLAAAGFVAWYLLSPMELPLLGVIAFAIAWITNLYNFMDGSDGLAGGMAAVGFGTYGFAAGLAGESALAATCWCVAAAAAAFLFYNFPPARIFLGDVGSIPLGFLAGALGILGWRNDAWPLWFPLLVFAPFFGDATLTLLKRGLRRERVWQAHREHYYQRLVRMGFGHRGTALFFYAVMAACAAAALAAREQAPAVQALVFCTASVGLALIAGWIDLRWRRHMRGAAV
jgi:UDP-N-acetylmuramyl pentapeptide phosphotransferase/UDP-N-acetylglucosamine-1-phosphate transferase